jgi:cytochrome c5
MNTEEDALFVRNFSVILVFVVAVGLAAFVLAKLVNQGYEDMQVDDDVVIAERLAPIGSVNIGEPFIIAAGGAPTVAATTESTAAIDSAPTDPGKATYGKICFACHDAGVGGAPKLGDALAWAGRSEKGFEMMVSNAINGFTGELGIMAPKGGLPSLTDDEVKAAVQYMLDALNGGAAEASISAVPAAADSSAATPTDEAPAAASETTADESSITSVADGRGKEVYAAACFVCHDAGSAGAPKLGDTDGWSDRIKQGNEILYTHAVKGFMGETGLMPP